MKNIIISLILAILIVGGIVFFAVKSDDKLNSTQSAEVTDPIALERETGGAWVKANTNSSVVLAEYSDFQCPACATWKSLIDLVIEKYGKDIRFEYRDFPLQSIHKRAFGAAKAAEAAGRQGKFWEMHDLLFANQSTWSESLGFESIIKKYATELKLNTDQFMDDYNSKVVSDIVQSDIVKGNKLGINATPTLYLNNEKIQPQSEEDFYKLIEEAIDSSKRKANTNT